MIAGRPAGLAGEHAQLLMHVAIRAEAPLALAAAGRYGFAYLEDGPGRWRVQITRHDEP